ncbi:MAG: 3-phosphoshikimate 1-carboxyvinyltransferase [Actinomycetota bacterium]
MLIEPLGRPVDADVVVPGSKSVTNRALVCAVLAAGTSHLTGVLDADDTQAMLGVAEAIGAGVEQGAQSDHYAIAGTGGDLRPGPVSLDVRMSGTTARFATPLAARGTGTYLVDGAPEMRARPMDESAASLRSVGVGVEGDTLPLTVRGGFAGGSLMLAADVSSQFASGMLLAAPGTEQGLQLTLEGEVVSRPYLDMTVAVMRAFGAEVEQPSPNEFVVAPGKGYTATDYRIEPDASAASYFFAMAAVTGGRVRIEGLGTDSLQGDVDFVDVLAEMGATVDKQSDSVEVRGPDKLRGVSVDMSQISDTAQTLAAIAPFADGPTRVTGIGFIRHKETDRVAAPVTELRRMGIDAVEEDDGFLINPGVPQPATIETYHDHRMAMSFAITGLMTPGIDISDPGCVNKTFPTYWDVLTSLR